MKIELHNEWRGNSLKDGGAFPITLINAYADIHKSYRYFSITILNFYLVFDLKEHIGYKKPEPEE